MTPRVAIIACGAIALHVRAAADALGTAVDIHPLPPVLHNRPERIAPAVREKLAELAGDYDVVAVGYGDCGSNGAIAAVCAEQGIRMLTSRDCYVSFAGLLVDELLAEEPGTYLLTDFLVRTFEYSVWRQLGLDRYPELRDDYFRHYRRVVWLSQRPTATLRAEANRAAAMLGLGLVERNVGEHGLVEELRQLLRAVTTAPIDGCSGRVGGPSGGREA